MRLIRSAMVYATINSIAMKTVSEICGLIRIFINAKGTKGEISNDLAGIIDVMNQKPNQTNPLASKLMKEIDYYNQDSEKRRERGLVLFPVANTLLI